MFDSTRLSINQKKKGYYLEIMKRHANIIAVSAPKVPFKQGKV